MIWFNLKRLEKLILDGELTDKLTFQYLLTHLIFMTISSYLSGDNSEWVNLSQMIVSLIAVIWAIRKTFEINKEGDNQEYFKRLISISFVAGIRVVVFLFPALFVIYLVAEIFDATGVPIEMSSFQEELMELTGFIFVTLFYYYTLFSSFKRINSTPGEEGQLEAI